MGFRRKYARRIKRSYRKKSYRKLMKRSMYNMRQNVVSIKRSYVGPAWAISAGGWNGTQYAFSLSQLPNYTEFTSLFEQYKINGIKITFLPLCDGVDANQYLVNTNAAIAAVQLPRIYTAIDKDGNGQTSSENAMLQYGTHRIVRDSSKAFSVYIKHPNVQVATANSTTLVGGAPKGSQWLDCDNYNVQHWGAVVGGVFSGTLNSTWTYHVIVTYYMQFKNAV